MMVMMVTMTTDDDDDSDDDDVVRRKGFNSWNPQNNGPPRGMVAQTPWRYEMTAAETAEDCVSAKLKGTRG